MTLACTTTSMWVWLWCFKPEKVVSKGYDHWEAQKLMQPPKSKHPFIPNLFWEMKAYTDLEHETWYPRPYYDKLGISKQISINQEQEITKVT